MEKIKGIHLKNLHNDEHFQFIDFVLELTGMVGAANLKAEPQALILANTFRLEDEAFRKINKSAFTAKITEADHARDIVFRGLADTVQATLNHFDPQMREAAVNVKIVFDTYGNVNKLSDSAETAEVYNLLQELKDKHQADVDKLKLGPWITELEQRNHVVKNLIADRVEDDSDHTQLVLRGVRMQVDEAYYSFTAMVDAQSLVATTLPEPDATAIFDNFIRKLNDFIGKANHALAIRRGIAAAKTDE